MVAVGLSGPQCGRKMCFGTWGKKAGRWSRILGGVADNDIPA
jgi:hypothetical protein